MAVDTRQERTAALGTHWNPMYPAPDGEVSLEDRRMVVGVYPIDISIVVVFSFLHAVLSVYNDLTYLSIYETPTVLSVHNDPTFLEIVE